MGALHKFDLTSDVTHLIVGDIDTPKYKFVARERLDVKCVLAGWLEAVREAWMTENEVKVEDLERRYALPTFAGMNICLTGFVDRKGRFAHALILAKSTQRTSGRSWSPRSCTTAVTTCQT